MTTSNPTTELEALDRSRRNMMLAVVVTSTLWMVPQILQGAANDALPRSLNNGLILAGVAGALAFVFFMMRFHRFQMRVLGDPELRRRLDDERVQSVRREAIYRGWFVMIVAVAIGVGVAPFVELPDQSVLLTLLLLGVNAPLVFFLILDRG